MFPLFRIHPIQIMLFISPQSQTSDLGVGRIVFCVTWEGHCIALQEGNGSFQLRHCILESYWKGLAFAPQEEAMSEAAETSTPLEQTKQTLQTLHKGLLTALYVIFRNYNAPSNALHLSTSSTNTQHMLVWSQRLAGAYLGEGDKAQ